MIEKAENARSEPLRWFLNSLVSLQLKAAESEDRISVIQHWMPQGDSPPLHIHHTEDEIFHIIEGRVRFRVGEVERVAGPGDTLLAPKGVAHSYMVESDGARCLTITRGRDFETMLMECSVRAESNSLPPFAALSSEAAADLSRRCTENNIDIIGPPLGVH